MTCDAYCEGCYYYGPYHQTCDYWEKADQLRGCPPGKGCTRRITKKEYMKMAAPSKWNKAVGYEMWKDGKSDKEIGEALGVTAQAVALHRKKYWEPNKTKLSAPVPTELEVEELPQSEPEQEEDIQAEPVADETSAEECVVQEDPLQEEDQEEAEARLMIKALQSAVQDLKGMKAVLTFQILQALWNWNTTEELKDAKTYICALIEMEEGTL